jgi:hypothetical protein
MAQGELFTVWRVASARRGAMLFQPQRKDVFMGTFLIALSVAWFVMALMFVFALAAAGRRLCPGLDSRLNVLVLQIPATKREADPPFLFGEENVVPAT